MLAAAALIVVAALATMTVATMRQRSKDHLAIRIRVDEQDPRDPRNRR